MKPIALKVDSFHVVLRALAAGRIFAAIQPARHPQAFRRRRLGNELDHGFIVTQGFAAPIRRNKGKEAVFDLVPFAGPGRKMADRQGQADLIRPCLQFQFPQAQPPAVAAPSVSRDQDLASVRIEPSAFIAPPAADRGDGKRARVVVGSDIDKSGVAPDVVDAIGIGLTCPP